MPRYSGQSPFQERGLVWSQGNGLLLLDDTARPISVKPAFEFPFDALFCEPTLCHRVVGLDELALTFPEITEVQAYLEARATEPAVFSGVDADGRYREGVPRNEIVRVVSTPPPSRGAWRFDFSKPTGDHWHQAWCVDAHGRYMAGADEREAAAVVTVPPPSVQYDEDWHWDFNTASWRDARDPAEILTSHRRRKTAEAWLHMEYRLDAIETITVLIDGVPYQFGCDRETRENIIGLVAAINAGVPISNPRPWFPKGHLSSIMISHADVAAIGGALLAKKDACYGVYFTHKANIMALTDPAAIQAYDVTRGY